MKIIKQGNTNLQEKYILTCRTCGCVVEVIKAEMSTLISEGHTLHYVVCPTCTKRIYK